MVCRRMQNSAQNCTKLTSKNFQGSLLGSALYPPINARKDRKDRIEIRRAFIEMRYEPNQVSEILFQQLKQTIQTRVKPKFFQSGFRLEPGPNRVQN